jgi:hypothetical protein
MISESTTQLSESQIISLIEKLFEIKKQLIQKCQVDMSISPDLVFLGPMSKISTVVVDI